MIKALWVEAVKRLPYVGLVLVILILFQVYTTGSQVAENVQISRENSETNKQALEKISALSEDNKKLSQDNKALSEQNIRLADQSNRYLNCLAELFAKHSRDGIPIVITDLDTCAAENTIFGQGMTEIGDPHEVIPPATPQATPATPAPSAPNPPVQTKLPPQAAPQAQENAIKRILNAPNNLLRRIL